MKIRYWILTLAIISLIGCSSIDEKSASKSVFLSEFLGGGLTLNYDSDGTLLSIESKAAAPVTSKFPSSQEIASKIAAAMARKQIAEFMNTSVNSQSVVETISSTIEQSGFTNEPNVSTEIATTLTESISVQSQAILRGAYLKSETYDSSANQLIVVVAIDKLR
jgi:hypothetical protein